MCDAPGCDAAFVRHVPAAMSAASGRRFSTLDWIRAKCQLGRARQWDVSVCLFFIRVGHRVFYPFFLSFFFLFYSCSVCVLSLVRCDHMFCLSNRWVFYPEPSSFATAK